MLYDFYINLWNCTITLLILDVFSILIAEGGSTAPQARIRKLISDIRAGTVKIGKTKKHWSNLTSAQATNTSASAFSSMYILTRQFAIHF